MISQTSSNIFSPTTSRPALPLNRDGTQLTKPEAAFNVDTPSRETVPAELTGIDLLHYYESIGDQASAMRESRKQDLAIAQTQLAEMKSIFEGATRLVNDWEIMRDGLRDQLSNAPADKRDRLAVELNITESQLISLRSDQKVYEKSWTETLARVQPEIDRLSALLAEDTESASARAEAAAKAA